MLDGIESAFEVLTNAPWAGKLVFELANASLGRIQPCGTSGKYNVAGQIDSGVRAMGVDERSVPFTLLQNK